MGLIMLILVRTLPTAYALNHAVTASQVQTFTAVSQQVSSSLGSYVDKNAVMADAGADLENFVTDHNFKPTTMLALRQTVNDIENEVTRYGALGKVPSNMQANIRNQMYLVSETMRLL